MYAIYDRAWSLEVLYRNEERFCIKSLTTMRSGAAANLTNEQFDDCSVQLKGKSNLKFFDKMVKEDTL